MACGADASAASPIHSRNVAFSSCLVLAGTAHGVVVRTGAATSQGELLRSIMGASSAGKVVDYDAFVFLAVMLVFALGASGYVLREGLRDPSRDRWKLVLHCIMIITSVVPPELPMELSLAVTNSLAALNQSMVFCTEPFRIAYAGELLPGRLVG